MSDPRADLEKLLAVLGARDGSVLEALERIAIMQENARDLVVLQAEVEECKLMLQARGVMRWAGRSLVDMLSDTGM